MLKQNRKWSEADKLQIIQEAEQSGVTETLRKYNLAKSLLQRWRQLYDAGGIEGLKPKHNVIDPELRRLQQENERLMKIVAKQALEIEFKNELLKKSL